MPLFKRVTIVGLGLIGGSLGMAMQRRRLATTVVGLSRKPATLRRAKARRAIDVGMTDARRAVQDADLVILATPVDRIVPDARRLAHWMRPGSILTDVGSTKAHIVSTLDQRLPQHVAFVGAHPLAGSEQRGIEAAQPRLFEGSLCILTPTTHTDPRSLRRVKRLWSAVAHRVIELSPQQHDRVLAATSHLTHLLASCLTLTADSQPLPCPPPSFLEMTRIAKSDPDLWDDIFVTNRVALLHAMDRFDHQWQTLRTLLKRQDRAALRRLLTRAQTTRDALD